MIRHFLFPFINFCKFFFLPFGVISHSSIPCLLYISRVVTNGKMKWVDAFFIIAGMQHKFSFWYFPIVDFIRKPMRFMKPFTPSSFLENSVTSCRYSTYPIPARFTFKNLSPESFFCRLS